MLKILLLMMLWLCIPVFSFAEILIGVSMAHFDDYYLSILREAIADEAQQHPGVTLRIVDAQENVSRQQAQLTQFIAQKAAAIIVNPVDVEREPVEKLIQLARPAGIPLVFVNRKPNVPLDEGVYYVGSDDKIAGKLQMEYLAELTHGKGNVVILVGKQNSGAAQERTQSVKAVIAQHPQMHLVDEQIANFSRTEGEAVMTRWLHQGTQFDIVAANNDEMALGALIAMKKAGVSTKSIRVAGIDATPDALYSMYKGELAVTVFQDANAQGALALKTALALTEKTHHLPSEQLIPYQLVTPENYRFYLRK
ncbi:substrate-binding domain-containing protein [Tolumonas lignilytica]|uniref:substrate-binding domain-containing protein n=1 Tax=Tolumonas lignilytica TaxID=1283284 RepID=UPI0004647759|nr:substrate-binding domain-containing protein [Tolumonas lignilytica]